MRTVERKGRAMSRTEMQPAVVLSSHIVGLGVIRALGTMGVPITAVSYESQDMGFVSKYVKKRIAAPHPERHEQEFVRILMEQADPSCRAVLIPADDATLSTVSKHKAVLESRYVVACPDARVTEQFITKKYTYEIAGRIGVRVPKTMVPRSVADLERCATEIGFPCLVKPCQSHRYVELFKRKLLRVENLDEMRTEYTRSSAAGIEVMIQELIPGADSEGANYNSFFWNDEPLVEFTAAKVRLSPPSFGVPRVVVSKEIPEIKDLGRKVLAAMGFSGYSCVEFKKDARDGRYTLMEVNGRHNRSGLLALRCGINFPWIEYQHRIGGGLRRPDAAPDGIYWIDEFLDVVESVRCASQERFPLVDYVRPYLAPHVLATFSLKDPKPFLKRCSDVTKIAAAALASRAGRGQRRTAAATAPQISPTRPSTV
jgi:D-aspartate ligase